MLAHSETEHNPDDGTDAPSPPAGRYSVEFNGEGVSEGIGGDWTHFSSHDSLLDAIRASSELMELAKDALGIGRVDDRGDDTIEPWIRIMDLREASLVAWVDNGALQVHQPITVG